MKNKFVTTTNNNLPLTVNITLTIFFLIVVRQIRKSIDQINYDLQYKKQNKEVMIALLNNQIQLKQKENELNKRIVQIEENEKLASFEKNYNDQKNAYMEKVIKEKETEIKALKKKKTIYMINISLMAICTILALLCVGYIGKILMGIFKSTPQRRTSSSDIPQENIDNSHMTTKQAIGTIDQGQLNLIADARWRTDSRNQPTSERLKSFGDTILYFIRQFFQYILILLGYVVIIVLLVLIFIDMTKPTKKQDTQTQTQIQEKEQENEGSQETQNTSVTEN